MGAPAIMGLIGATGGAISQWMANDANERINQANMQHDLYMLLRQQDFANEQAEKADARTRALYNDLQSPEAIRRQLEQAGLSVGMMYGQGGVGGHMSSGAQAASPMPLNHASIPMGSILDAQTANMIANTLKTEAETKKTNAEAKKAESEIPKNEKTALLLDEQINKTRAEVQTEMAKLNQIIAETNVSKATESEIKARTAYQETLNEIANIDLSTRDAINHATLEQLETNIQKLHQESAKLGLDIEIVEKTKKAVIRKAIYECLSTVYNYENILPEQKTLIEKTIGKVANEGVTAFYNAQTEKDVYNALDNLGSNKGAFKVMAEIIKILISAL